MWGSYHIQKKITVCGHNMVEGRWGWNCLEVEIYGCGEIGVKGEDAGHVWCVGKNPKEKEKIQKVKVPTWRNKNHRWRHLLWPHGNAPLRTSHETHILLRASDLFRKGNFKQHLPSDQIFTALRILFLVIFFLHNILLCVKAPQMVLWCTSGHFYWQHKHQRKMLHKCH